jgi:uncharacterized membrane protein YhiD involved in acid resistance
MSFFNEFYTALTDYPSQKSVFNAVDVLLNFIVPVVSMIPITKIYKKTHKGATYNQSFTHTMFIMSVTTSIIMMIIGSNIARAFSLVGALSIIRFRTAIKDSRDTGYIFSAIAIGMAAGTGMYLVSLQFTILISILLFALSYFEVGRKVVADKVLKISTKEKCSQDDLQSTLVDHVQSYALVHSEELSDAGNSSLTYIITTKDEKDDQKLIESLNSKFNLSGTSIYYNDQRVEI